MQIRDKAVIDHRPEINLVTDFRYHLMKEIVSSVHIENRVCAAETCGAGRA